MQKSIALPLVTLLALSLALNACDSAEANEDAGGSGDSGGDGNDDGGDGDGDGDCAVKGETANYELVDGNIEADTTWSCDKVYVIAPDAQVFVKNADLTIEPGTTVLGNTGAALVIDRDARLIADGTEDMPIVMTSFQESPTRGDWGGLVLLGNATVNLAGGTGIAEGFANGPTYGGDDDSHDCGSLSYLRVEYAGFAISDGNELNGITFYACGTGTSVHHVQSHMGADDGIECFGGTFDMDHIVVTGEDDDALDFDQGYRGVVQYVAIQHADNTGNNGLEWSNQGTDFVATPLTSPVICNATMVGSNGDKSQGFTFKEGNEAQVWNSIVTGFSGPAGTLSNSETQALAEAGDIALMNNIFIDNGTPAFECAIEGGWNNADFEAWVMDAANNNSQDTDPGLADTGWGSANLMPGDAVSGAGAAGGGCEATTYIGAVEPGGDNWAAASWINWTP